MHTRVDPTRSDGKEGVDGSSPSEGFRKFLLISSFRCRWGRREQASASTERTETLRSRAVAACLYAEGEREMGREGDFEFQSALGPIRARAQLFPNEDGTLRLNFAIDEKTSTARFQRVVIWGVND
jgi:hypothetical protein